MTTDTRIESLETQVKILKRLLRWTWIGWSALFLTILIVMN